MELCKKIMIMKKFYNTKMLVKIVNEEKPDNLRGGIKY